MKLQNIRTHIYKGTVTIFGHLILVAVWNVIKPFKKQPNFVRHMYYYIRFINLRFKFSYTINLINLFKKIQQK